MACVIQLKLAVAINSVDDNVLQKADFRIRTMRHGREELATWRPQIHQRELYFESTS